MRYLLSFIVLILVNPLFSQEIECNNCEQLWVSEKVFQIPESVYCDNDYDVLYVSNINGSPVVKDGNGFISKLGKDGKLIDLKWIEGLNAPKGMGKYGDILFVADIDELVEIEINSGKILERHKVEGAKFLNDVAIDDDGMVYISDTQNGVIYSYDGNKVEEWFSDDSFNGLNGLFYFGNAIYAASVDQILKINIFNRASKVAAIDMGPIDGISIDEYNNYIISDFQGKVQYLIAGEGATVFFNSSDKLINAADICYDSKSGVLYVPTFRDGRVMAYRIN